MGRFSSMSILILMLFIAISAKQVKPRKCSCSISLLKDKNPCGSPVTCNESCSGKGKVDLEDYHLSLSIYKGAANITSCKVTDKQDVAGNRAPPRESKTRTPSKNGTRKSDPRFGLPEPEGYKIEWIGALGQPTKGWQWLKDLFFPRLFLQKAGKFGLRTLAWFWFNYNDQKKNNEAEAELLRKITALEEEDKKINDKITALQTEIDNSN